MSDLLIQASVLAVAETGTGEMRGADDLIIAATRATGRAIVPLDRRGLADLPRVRAA